MAGTKLEIEVGSDAQSVREVVLEHRNVTSSLKWTGTRWLAEFPDYDVAAAGNVLEIEIWAEGIAGKCPWKVRLTGKKELSGSKTATPNGRYFIVIQKVFKEWSNA